MRGLRHRGAGISVSVCTRPPTRLEYLLSDFNPFRGDFRCALRELTALTSCPGRRAAFSPPQVMLIQLRWICGSKHSVRLHSIFCSSKRNQFLFPLSFFGISISLILHPDLLLEKLHRNHDLARIRAIGGSAQVSVAFSSPTPRNFTHPLLCSTLSFGGKQMQSQIWLHLILAIASTVSLRHNVSRYPMFPLPRTPQRTPTRSPSKPLSVVPIIWQLASELALSHP